MNRALLNPFASSDLPKGIEETLTNEHATCATFNRHGNILAVGTCVTKLVLWDFDARAIAATLQPPETAVPRGVYVIITAVAFPAPRNGSAVLAVYHPDTVRLFDTLSQRMVTQVTFEGIKIVDVVSHPKETGIAVIVPERGHPLLLYMRRGVYRVAKDVWKEVRDATVVLEAPACEDQMGCEGERRYQLPKRADDAFGNRIFAKVPKGGDALRFSVLCTKDEFLAEDGPSVELGSRKKSSFCVAFTRAGDRVLRAGPTGIIRAFALVFEGREGKSQQVLGDRGESQGISANDDEPSSVRHDAETPLGSSNNAKTDKCVNRDTRAPGCRRGEEQVPYEQCQIPRVIHESAVSVQGKSSVRAIVLSRKEQNVLVNSYDRCMRLFKLDQILKPNRSESISRGKDNDYVVIEPRAMFTEIVNKNQCTCACFSSDGEYVVGGMEGAEHRIHIWRAIDANLELTLEGGREGVKQVAWHPSRRVVMSVGQGTGNVYIWAKNMTENWSAFANEFSELEENEEYVEAEDEFDLKDAEDKEALLRAREEAEAGFVDVDTCNQQRWFSSDSETEDSYFYIPAVPEADEDNNLQSLSEVLIRAQMAGPDQAGSPESPREKESVEIGRKRGSDSRKRGRPAKRQKAAKKKNANDNSANEQSADMNEGWVEVRPREEAEGDAEVELVREVKMVDVVDWKKNVLVRKEGNEKL